MVHHQPNKDNTLPQFREPSEPDSPAGRPPRANEVIGHGGRFHQVTGMDALSPILAHVPFPASKGEIIAILGDARIAIDKVATMPVRAILDMTAPETFASQQDLERAIQHVWNRIQPHYENGRGAHHQKR